MGLIFKTVPPELEGLVELKTDYLIAEKFDEFYILENRIVVFFSEGEHFTVTQTPIKVGHLTADVNEYGKVESVKVNDDSRGYFTVCPKTLEVRATFMGVITEEDMKTYRDELGNAITLSNILKCM